MSVEPLDHPPEAEEGDNSVAGGGAPADPVTEADLEDAPSLQDADENEEADDDG